MTKHLRHLLLAAVALALIAALVFLYAKTQAVDLRERNDIAALIDVYRGYPQDADQAQIRKIAQDKLGLVVDFLPLSEMPPPGREKEWKLYYVRGLKF